MGVIKMYNVYRVITNGYIDDGENVDLGKVNAYLNDREMDDKIIPDNSKKYFEYYTVRKGDSIYEIARRYNINPDLLASLNGLNNSDYIYPNQTILIPKSNYSYYITKAGDTIDSVINMLEVDRNKFFKDNNVIYLLEGQLLVKEK